MSELPCQPRVAIKRGCPADKQCHLLAVVCIAGYRVPNKIAKVGKWHFENIPYHHANEFGKIWQ